MTSRFPTGTVVNVMSPVVEAPSANPPTAWASKGCLAGLSTSRTGTGLAVVLTTFTFEGDGTACVADGSAKHPSTNAARNSGVAFLSWINGFMGIFPFRIPALLILRLQVWRRRRT
jgi:hypothetical protein